MEDGPLLSGVTSAQFPVEIEEHLLAVIACGHVIPQTGHHFPWGPQVSHAARLLRGKAEVELILPVAEDPSPFMCSGVVHGADEASPFNGAVDLDPGLCGEGLARKAGFFQIPSEQDAASSGVLGGGHESHELQFSITFETIFPDHVAAEAAHRGEELAALDAPGFEAPLLHGIRLS